LIIDGLKAPALGPFSLWDSYFFVRPALSNLNVVRSHIPFRNPDPANVVSIPDAVVWRVAMVLAPSAQGFNGTGVFEDGHLRSRHRRRLLRHVLRLRQSLRHPLKERQMLLEYILGGAVTVFLLVYLTYALIRPERF
jgi:K+-transporting ATPase KdpF subunit